MEKSLTLCADHMIVLLQNPKLYTQKLLELINEFQKVTGYTQNINTYKVHIFPHTNNEHVEKN